MYCCKTGTQVKFLLKENAPGGDGQRTEAANPQKNMNIQKICATSIIKGILK